MGHKILHRLYTYEVWGNVNDGFWVNNVFKENTTFGFELSWSYEHIFQVLKGSGLFKKGLHSSSIRIDGEIGGALYLTDLRAASGYYKPLCELRAEFPECENDIKERTLQPGGIKDMKKVEAYQSNDGKLFIDEEAAKQQDLDGLRTAFEKILKPMLSKDPGDNIKQRTLLKIVECFAPDYDTAMNNVVTVFAAMSELRNVDREDIGNDIEYLEELLCIVGGAGSGYALEYAVTLRGWIEHKRMLLKG